MGRVRTQEATEYARSPRSSMGSPMAAARIASGLTQQQLADMLGVSRNNVNQWETGARKLPLECADSIRRITGYTPSSENENINEARLHVGRLIRARREALGLSRQALADLLGLKSQRSVYLWESGKHLPLPCTLDRIASALSCQPEDIGGAPRTKVSARIEAIRQMRIASGLSYRELSRLTDLSDHYLSDLERTGVSEPADRTVALVARACGCNPSDYGIDIPENIDLSAPPKRVCKYAEFGTYLKACRERSGLSCRELAEHLGVVKTLVSQYERGVVLPPRERIPALAELLGEPAERMNDMRSIALPEIVNPTKPHSKRVYRYTDFGAYLKACRERAGLSRRELAEHLGVVKTLVSQYERGVVLPPRERIPALAELLGEPAEQMTVMHNKSKASRKE